MSHYSKRVWPNCDLKAPLVRIVFRIKLNKCMCVLLLIQSVCPNFDFKPQLGRIIFVGVELELEKGVWHNCDFKAQLGRIVF